MTRQLVLAITLGALATSAGAEMKVEDAIKFRQSGYAFMAWNMGKIKAQVIENPASFNKDQVQAAANAIAAIANSGMGALYVPGSDQGKGWADTRVKPELFQKGDEVKKAATAFNKEANELAKVAAGGDVAAIAAQFGKVGQTCKGCHDDFRKD
jgi:cytochrome c556